MLKRAAERIARISQPLPQTHSHLFEHVDELTPGILAAEYADRRRRLAASLAQNEVAVVVGHPTRFATFSIFYPFQQNTNFLYLTGLNEPDCAAVIEKDLSAPEQHKLTLFVPLKSVEEKRWSGEQTGIEGAKSIFKANTAYSNTLFANYFEQLLSDRKTVYLDERPKLLSSELYPIKSIYQEVTSSRRGEFSSIVSSKVKPLTQRIQELRLLKSDSEQRVLGKACTLSGNGFETLTKSLGQLKTEHQVASALEHQFKMSGLTNFGYVPVVAGGVNACTLHYVHNDMSLEENDLVLIDAGGIYGHYSSDITRTLPMSGRFTEPQRELYNAVLTTQKMCIELCCETQMKSLDDIHHISVDILFRQLKALGYTGTAEKMSDQMYFHHVGHYLGMDIHDTPAISRSRTLKSGMVITIEPGIYVLPHSDMPSKYHHIGIRIEDNVLVGKSEVVVLTSSAPKEISEVER